MKLTFFAQQSLDFSQACFFQGLCTTKEYMKAIETIYVDDVKKQIDFLSEKGITRRQALHQIYGLGKEQIV